MELEVELPEDLDSLGFWLSRESQHTNIVVVALDLVSAPMSQAYVEIIVYVCGDLTARKRDRTTVNFERRVFFKTNRRAINKLNLSDFSDGPSQPKLKSANCHWQSVILRHAAELSLDKKFETSILMSDYAMQSSSY